MPGRDGGNGRLFVGGKFRFEYRRHINIDYGWHRPVAGAAAGNPMVGAGQGPGGSAGSGGGHWLSYPFPMQAHEDSFNSLDDNDNRL